MEQDIREIVEILSTAPDGLSATQIRRRLRRPLSQPTLWRRLEAMRSRGLVIVEGRARATRYHATSRTARPELRSRRLHEGVARQLVRDPGLLSVARDRLQMLRRINPHGRVYHDRWAELMDGPLPHLLQMLTEESEAAHALRKESPFTVLVRPADRRRVFAALHAA